MALCVSSPSFSQAAADKTTDSKQNQYAPQNAASGSANVTPDQLKVSGQQALPDKTTADQTPAAAEQKPLAERASALIEVAKKAAQEALPKSDQSAAKQGAGKEVAYDNSSLSELDKSLPPPPMESTRGIDIPGLPSESALAIDGATLDAQADEAAQIAANEKVQREADFNRRSFEKASRGLMPLSPDQIREFMRRLENMQESAQPPSSGQPKGDVKVATLSLDPGSKPPQIELAAGYVTTVALVDITGAPWPIVDVGVGGNFEITPTQAGSHVMRIMPLTRVGTGNLSIMLKDLPTPVILQLSSGGASFHMRYDARVPKIGPNGKVPIIDRGRKTPLAGDEVITAVLENQPPKGAKRLKISGIDSRTMAWQIADKIYVRTPLSLLSPAWNSSASSADGMTVYEIGEAPVLLMSQDGAMVRARLTRDEQNER